MLFHREANSCSDAIDWCRDVITRTFPDSNSVTRDFRACSTNEGTAKNNK